MCGIVAFWGRQPDLFLLAQLADEAGRRGTDGSGWAMLDPTGRWIVHRDPYTPLAALQPPGDIATARAVVGHARLATDGGIDAANRVQPYLALHPLATAAVALNGAVPGLWPSGDTAVLRDAVTVAGPERGLQAFLELAGQEGAERLAAVAVSAHGLWTAQRVGHYGPMPLHVAVSVGGVYVCSRQFPGSRPINSTLHQWGAELQETTTS